MSNQEIKRDLEADRIWIVEDSHKTTPLDRIALHAIYRALTAEHSLELAIKETEEIREFWKEVTQEQAKEYIESINAKQDKLNLAVKALEEIQQLKGNIRPDGEAWEYVGEFNEAMKIAQSTLDQIRRVET